MSTRSDTTVAGPATDLTGTRVLVATLGSVVKPRGGMQARTRLAAELLTGQGAEVVVVSTTEPPGDPPSWATSVTAPPPDRFWRVSPRLVGLLAEGAAGCTAVLLSDPTLLPALTAARVRQPIVWDTNECQSLHFARLPPTPSNRAQRLAWLAFERWAARRCAVAVAIGQVEVGAWRSTHPVLRSKLAVVDHAPLWSARDRSAARTWLDEAIGGPPGPIVLFLGTMGAKQNAAAARWMADTLADALDPGTRIVLCGPGSEVMGRPARTGAPIIGLGAVDDVDSVVAAADLCIAPLAAGAGVKTKVLHYIAHGRPVAGTPVAFEGLEGAPGLTTATLDDLPAVVRRMISGEDSAPASARQQDQGAWLEANHGTAHIAQQWREVFGCLAS